jgi:hypothetical protein
MVRDGVTIHYINTDLDIISQSDLTKLSAFLESRGLLALHLACDDGLNWRGCFETSGQHNEPEHSIGAMLEVIENLSADVLDDWQRCSVRQFNIGYASGHTPHVLGQGLGNRLLRRIAPPTDGPRTSSSRPTNNP